jgi:hypothetical protein
MGDFLVAQHAFAGMEGAKNVEAAGQRRDELPVFAVRSLGETILYGTLEGGGSRDEMADVAHGVFSYKWPFIFVTAKTATGMRLPQCAAPGFDLRTCKAAMSQMRDSLSTVVKARIFARNRSFSASIGDAAGTFR